MQFFQDTLAEKPRIERAIEKYGYAPEHNFWWYQCQSDKNSKNIFAESKDGFGLLTIEWAQKNKCIVFSSPLAPQPRRVEIILEYLDCIFQSKEIKKITLELADGLYKEFLKSLPGKFKTRAVNYILAWPVYDLNLFDVSLSGNSWKSLRKTKNKFYKNHSVSVTDVKNFENVEALSSIIGEWRNKRNGNDRAHFHPYEKFISSGFKGALEARILTVDGLACGINAGWMIPNSNRFYGALGIHNYSLPELGDVLYLEDLTWLKEHGYKEADMGGGEATLNSFKNKFHPKSFYETYTFSVVKS